MTQQDPTQHDSTQDIAEELQAEIDEVTKAEEALEADLEDGQIYQAEEELAKLKEALARAQADYQNLLRRVDRDRVDMTSFITASLLKKILPTVDNLARATSTVPADLTENAWVKGIASTYAGFAKQLESLGLQSFESLGKEADPEYHEVMSQTA